MYAFVPWVAFWSQGGSTIQDQSWLKVGVSSQPGDCRTLNTTFKAKVARTDIARTIGLSGRSTPLARDEAMLFVFDAPEPVSFWMKNTLIPIDIHFFDAKGNLLRSLHMPVEKDPANPMKSYESGKPALTALEVAPGAIKSVKPLVSKLCVETLPSQ